MTDTKLIAVREGGEFSEQEHAIMRAIVEE